MWQSKRQPRVSKTCDFCNQSAFGLMRRHEKGKTFCSVYCEASFTTFARGSARSGSWSAVPAR